MLIVVEGKNGARESITRKKAPNMRLSEALLEDNQTLLDAYWKVRRLLSIEEGELKLKEIFGDIYNISRSGHGVYVVNSNDDRIMMLADAFDKQIWNEFPELEDWAVLGVKEICNHCADKQRELNKLFELDLLPSMAEG